MQVLADHVYHVLVIAFVATTVIEVIVKAVNRPRKKKRGPVAPRESAAEREKRMRERYAAFGDRWREWLDRPRGSGDADRLVTAASVWGSPEQGASFPRRFHDSQLGKVMLDKRSYLAMLDAPADALQPRRELAPASWATMRLDVWALHSKAAQKPRLMRVWISRDRALVELHRTRVVKVDEILPSEIVGFVRGFTRLGPRTGKVDGLRWLPAEAMELGERPLWNTFRVLRGISGVAPEGSPVADALRAGDYHAFAFVVCRAENMWRAPCAHLRILDCGGVTYQVGNAFAQERDRVRRTSSAEEGTAVSQARDGESAQAPRRGRGRPGEQGALRRGGGVADERGAATGGDGRIVNPMSSGLLGDEPAPLMDTDLAVVPIDPREVLWAVERMIEL